MGLLSRFFHPEWSRIEALPADQRWDLAALLVASGGWPSVLKDAIVPPLLGSMAAVEPRLKSISFSSDEMDRILAHTSFAAIGAVDLPDKTSSHLKVLDWHHFRGLLAEFLHAEAMHACGGPINVYSADPKQALSELVTYIFFQCTGDASPELAKMVCQGPAAAEWDGMVGHGLSGMLTGLGRVPQEVALRKAKQRVSELSEPSKAMLRFIAETSEARSGLFAPVSRSAIGLQAGLDALTAGMKHMDWLYGNIQRSAGSFMNEMRRQSLLYQNCPEIFKRVMIPEHEALLVGYQLSLLALHQTKGALTEPMMNTARAAAQVSIMQVHKKSWADQMKADSAEVGRPLDESLPEGMREPLEKLIGIQLRDADITLLRMVMRVNSGQALSFDPMYEQVSRLFGGKASAVEWEKRYRPTFQRLISDLSRSLQGQS